MNFSMWLSAILMTLNLVAAYGAYSNGKGLADYGISLALAALMGLCLYFERKTLLQERRWKKESEDVIKKFRGALNE